MNPRVPFFLPALGLIILFGALGPAIGGALFIPLSAYIEAPAETSSIENFGWIAGLIGHATALIPAYIVGIFPAALTGFAYALYDAWASRGAPRALGAAVIGAVISWLLWLWLAQVGAWMESWISLDVSGEAGAYIDEVFSGEFNQSLKEALIASGAIAALVCAFVASLIGLQTQPPPPQFAPGPPARTS